MGFSCLGQNLPAAPGAEPDHRLHLSELTGCVWTSSGGAEGARSSPQPRSSNMAQSSRGSARCWGEPRAEPRCLQRLLTHTPMNLVLAASPTLCPGCWSRGCTKGRDESWHLLHRHQRKGPAWTPTRAAESQLESRSSLGWEGLGDLPRCLQPTQRPVPQVLVSRVAAPSWHAAMVARFHARRLIASEQVERR